MDIDLNKYHKVLPNEYKRIVSYQMDIINAYDFFSKCYLRVKKHYIYTWNNRTCVPEILTVNFKKRHFSHLCGIEYKNGATKFTQDIKKNKIDVKNIYIKNDGSTFQKLDLLANINILNTINTEISSSGMISNKHYDTIINDKRKTLGLVIKKDNNGSKIPISLLSISKDYFDHQTSFPVLAIIDEEKMTKEHSKTCICRRSNCPNKVNEFIDNLLKEPKQ